ncbi:MAG: hypothetical protein KDA91_23740 [Planctomycetaceae bacterium]|nr:hypothetical protein [Planctomycetaceae bacterium]
MPRTTQLRPAAAAELGRVVLAAMLTVTIGSAALGQTDPRIGRADTNFDSLGRMLTDPGMTTPGQSIRGPGYLNSPPQVDLSKVDQRVVANLLKEAVVESDRLYTALDADYRRNPSLRPLFQDLFKLQSQAKRLNQDLANRVPLQDVLVNFRMLDSDWRNLSHQLSQTAGLSAQTRESVDRINRIDQEVGKLFSVEPTLDRGALLSELSTMNNALRVLVDELEYDPNTDRTTQQLIVDVRKLQQQTSRIESMVWDNISHKMLVDEYTRFSLMWSTTLERLRPLGSNRYIERQVRYLVDSENKIQQLLWMENKSNRAQLKQTAVALMRDVDEFYNRTALKLLLNVREPAAALQTANDFYGTVENIKDLIDRNESDANIVDAYQYVEEYGYTFIKRFDGLNSQAARIVLREIEDGIHTLRTELNLSGTVTQIDYRSLIQLAASLENLADHMDYDVKDWLNKDRQSFRAEALRASQNFASRCRRLHLMVEAQEKMSTLQKEADGVYQDWLVIYRYLSQCRTEDRTHLAQLAREVTQAIYDISAPLQLNL